MFEDSIRQLAKEVVDSQIEVRHWRWIGKAMVDAVDSVLAAVDHLPKSVEGIRMKILRDEMQELLDNPPDGIKK